MAVKISNVNKFPEIPPSLTLPRYTFSGGRLLSSSLFWVLDSEWFIQTCFFYHPQKLVYVHYKSGGAASVERNLVLFAVQSTSAKQTPNNKMKLDK